MRTAFEAVELKASKETRILEGYLATWAVDKGDDQFEQGALGDSIAQQGQKNVLLWQHRKDSPIGVSDRLVEESKGVYFRDKMANTRLADEAMELVEMKAVTGVSLGYSVLGKTFVNLGSRRVRKIQKAKLIEHSLVTFPMNDEARITSYKQDGFDIRDLFDARRQAQVFLKSLGTGIAGVMNAILANANDNRETIVASIVNGTGLSYSDVLALGQGSPRCPTQETVVALAKALGVDPEELLAVGAEDGCSYKLADGTTTNDDALVEEVEPDGRGAEMEAAKIELEQKSEKLVREILAFCNSAGTFVGKLEGLTPRAR